MLALPNNVETGIGNSKTGKGGVWKEDIKSEEL
jgi:hypothetical protein